MTSLLAVKLQRDLRASWSRFALMVAAIAVSLIVFGGVLFAWAAVGRETSGAYMGTEPASATIVLDQPIDTKRMAAIVAEVRALPGVIEATGRTQFSSEVEVNGRLRDIPLQVFVAAADDPLRMAKFSPSQGSWPPSPGEIFLGGDSLALLDVEVGDTLSLEGPSGQSLRLEVADSVYDPSLAPSPQEQTGRGYLSTAALTMSDRAVLDQLKIQVADPGQSMPSRDRDAVIAVASEVGEWLQTEHGLAIGEIQVPEPYTHPHQFQADSLLLSLLAGGAAALLLSTILVAAMLNTLFTQQIPQIGIMKAVGARTGRIGLFYLAMTLLVAAMATLLALGPATLISRAGLGQLLGLIGIEPVSLAPPGWAYVVFLAVGLGLPPMMALAPVVRASRITVRAAMDHRGLGWKPSAATGFLTRVSRIRQLDRGLLMALRNTVRRPARFWLSVGLLASAGVVFVAGISLSASVGALAEEQEQQRNWDVDVQLAGPVPVKEITTVVEQVPGVSRVEGWISVSSSVAGPGQIPLTRTYPDQGHGRISVTAFPPDTAMLTVPKLLEGRWLNPSETGAVVLNQITRNGTVPDIAAGDTVQLLVAGRATTWLVAGIVEELSGHGGVYTTAEGFASATGQPQLVNQLRIATESHDEPTRDSVADTTAQALVDAGFDVRSAASVARSGAIGQAHVGPIIIIILAIAVAMGVVGSIGLATTMSANILDRTREFGVMHAIGGSPLAVRRIVLAEGLFLALTSALVAVIPALALTAILGAGLGNIFLEAPLPYRVSWLAMGIWLVLVVLGGALAIDAAATRASRMTVREALAYI